MDWWSLRGGSKHRLWTLVPSNQSYVTWPPVLLPDLIPLHRGLGSAVGKNVVCLRGTRGHAEFISPDKEKNCRFALFGIIFVHCGSVFSPPSDNHSLPFSVCSGQRLFFTYLSCVCVWERVRKRESVGEILYLIFGNIWKEICTIKGYVRITGQPGVSVQPIHLLWLHPLLPVSWTYWTTYTFTGMKLCPGCSYIYRYMHTHIHTYRRITRVLFKALKIRLRALDGKFWFSSLLQLQWVQTECGG